MNSSGRKRVVILGGGFAGVYAARYLAKEIRKYRLRDVELVLVSRENYLVFQPLLAEVVSGNIGILDTVSPIHALCPGTRLFVRDILAIDVPGRTVTLEPGFQKNPRVLEFDHLVLALGTVTDFREIAGLREHAMPFKNLADALALRNHLIRVIEEANIEDDSALKKELLTVVIAGGGFSGVELAAEVNDFLRGIARQYQGISREDLRVVLVHSGERILDREVGEKLALYAQNKIQKRGVEILLKKRLETATSGAAVLAGGEVIRTRTLVSTVPASPNPLVDTLPLVKDRGRIKVDAHLAVVTPGVEGVWALGDCAWIPNPGGEGCCPPTAQHAIREAKTVAKNIAAKLDRRPLRKFTFKGLGKMGSLGHRSAVAILFDKIRLSGLPAWFLWRTVYWWKLPGASRKVKVGISWFLDLLFSPETVQLKAAATPALRHEHFQPGQEVFHQGDHGDSLYIVREGRAEVVERRNGADRLLRTLGSGECFGEMALLHDTPRRATVRSSADGSLRVAVIRRRDFDELVNSLPMLGELFTALARQRLEEHGDA